MKLLKNPLPIFVFLSCLLLGLHLSFRQNPNYDLWGFKDTPSKLCVSPKAGCWTRTVVAEVCSLPASAQDQIESAAVSLAMVLTLEGEAFSRERIVNLYSCSPFLNLGKLLIYYEALAQVQSNDWQQLFSELYGNFEAELKRLPPAAAVNVFQTMSLNTFRVINDPPVDAELLKLSIQMSLSALVRSQAEAPQSKVQEWLKQVLSTDPIHGLAQEVRAKAGRAVSE
ncbi:MAG: hypothetical protein HRT45_02405 [Bdellovibrionales bacterium]|nr:hypothetical protein [Bdellovibrionales bacterium]